MKNIKYTHIYLRGPEKNIQVQEFLGEKYK